MSRKSSTLGQEGCDDGPFRPYQRCKAASPPCLQGRRGAIWTTAAAEMLIFGLTSSLGVARQSNKGCRSLPSHGRRLGQGNKGPHQPRDPPSRRLPPAVIVLYRAWASVVSSLHPTSKSGIKFVFDPRPFAWCASSAFLFFGDRSGGDNLLHFGSTQYYP